MEQGSTIWEGSQNSESTHSLVSWDKIQLNFNTPSKLTQASTQKDDGFNITMTQLEVESF